jgi:hypothetical protein
MRPAPLQMSSCASFISRLLIEDLLNLCVGSEAASPCRRDSIRRMTLDPLESTRNTSDVRFFVAVAIPMIRLNSGKASAFGPEQENEDEQRKDNKRAAS